jgi:rubrerythrin
MEFIKKALKRTAEKNQAEHDKWTSSSQSIEDIKPIPISESIEPLNKVEGAFYCTVCSNKTRTPKLRGNYWIEMFLWLYLIPGIIYSIWRRSGTPSVCPTCNKETLIPAALANPQGAPQVALTRIEVECHWCAELILAKAKSCKHCGKDNVSV